LCYVPEEIELTECELLVIVAIGNAPTMSDPARLKEPNLSTRLIEHYFVAMNESGRLARTQGLVRIQYANLKRTIDLPAK
jgi:hypothetical protein